jgi:hypothetical protein
MAADSAVIKDRRYVTNRNIFRTGATHRQHWCDAATAGAAAGARLGRASPWFQRTSGSFSASDLIGAEQTNTHCLDPSIEKVRLLSA